MGARQSQFRSCENPELGRRRTAESGRRAVVRGTDPEYSCPAAKEPETKGLPEPLNCPPQRRFFDLRFGG